MAKWTTEKEFDHPSTRQKGVTTNIQVSTTKLTDRQRKILEAIKNNTTNVQVNVQVNDQVNVQKLATLLGFSEKAIRRDLYVLRDMNLIHYIGSDKTGHWEVTNKTNQ